MRSTPTLARPFARHLLGKMVIQKAHDCEITIPFSPEKNQAQPKKPKEQWLHSHIVTTIREVPSPRVHRFLLFSLGSRDLWFWGFLGFCPAPHLGMENMNLPWRPLSLLSQGCWILSNLLGYWKWLHVLGVFEPDSIEKLVSRQSGNHFSKEDEVG